MMSGITAEETQAYIDKYYVTRSELARLADISEERIVELVDAKCIPPHAYEVRAETVYASSFGEYKLPSTSKHYYHPRLVEWIGQATRLAEKHPLPVVAEHIKAKFEEDIHKTLDGRPLPWPDGTALVWDYLMDGTWSLCLKDFNVSDLVRKEVARGTIAKIVKASSDCGITATERTELEDAVRCYDEVALPFSPHEVGESSRCLEVGSVVKKFGLNKIVKPMAAE
jgi:hypothetical protein